MRAAARGTKHLETRSGNLAKVARDAPSRRVVRAGGGLIGGTVTCKNNHAAPRASQLQLFDVAIRQRPNELR